jgi:hypothetical protein
MSIAIPDDPVAHAGPRVLVVHLVPSARFCEIALERAGCEVTSAADLSEARALLARLAPDLVVVLGTAAQAAGLVAVWPGMVVRFGYDEAPGDSVPAYRLETLIAHVRSGTVGTSLERSPCQDMREVA